MICRGCDANLDSDSHGGWCSTCCGSECVVCHQWHNSLMVVQPWVHEELGTRSEAARVCKYCRQTTTLQELQALATAQAFRVWPGGGRREDAVDGSGRLLTPVPQPGRVLPFLYIGDLDDAADLPTLRANGITAVLCLCPRKDDDRYDFTGHSSAGIEVVDLEAQDDKSGDYDIIEQAWPKAEEIMARWRRQNMSILVNCYGGVNRSGAIVVAWLLTRERLSLREAIHRVTAARGTVLTNTMFRLQLLRLSRSVVAAPLVPERVGGDEHSPL